MTNKIRNNNVYPEQIEDAKIRLRDIIERGLKVPLLTSETIVIRHDVIRAMLPGLPSDLRRSGYNASKDELIHAGLESSLSGQVTMGGACACVKFPVNLTLKLRPSAQFIDKSRRLIEVLTIKFHKDYC